MSRVVAHARKVGTAVGVRNVGAHNCREAVYDRDGRPLEGELPEWISHPERSGLNEGDRCGGTAILKRRGERIRAAELSRKPQRNASAAVEITVSASPDWFESHKPHEWKAYFKDARAWLEENYGKANVLHWAVHYDETTPHMHVLFVPIRETSKGIAYTSSRFLGGRNGLRKLQDDLAAKVGAKYGLERGVRGSEARHTDQYEWAAKTARESADLALERGGLDIREQEVAKHERKVLDSMKKVAAGANAVTARQESINQQQAELDAREKELAARMKELPAMGKKAQEHLGGHNLSREQIDTAWGRAWGAMDDYVAEVERDRGRGSSSPGRPPRGQDRGR